MTGKPRIYLDTSVISALFDERNPERMNLTRDFMAVSGAYDICISEITTAELERTPDPIIRGKMTQSIASFTRLAAPEGTADLAKEYIQKGAIPESHPEDAYHIAVAVLNDIDHLLSWNFKHIVRLKTRDIVHAVNSSRDLPQINILTPGELL
jgi:predicted nucleic acid-binding protein